MDHQLVPGADLSAEVWQGETASSGKLRSLIYVELHAIARQCMRGQPRGHTLQPTALVHEAYLRLSIDDQWESRAHFVASAAQAMRCVLIDHARARVLRRHDSLEELSGMDQILLSYEHNGLDLLDLDNALHLLARFDPLMAKAVELRFFGGLEMDEVARVLRISKRTLEREWSNTRVWLYEAIS